MLKIESMASRNERLVNISRKFSFWMRSKPQIVDHTNGVGFVFVFVLTSFLCPFALDEEMRECVYVARARAYAFNLRK